MHQLTHQTITTPQIRAEGRGFAFVGQFRVTMRLDQSANCSQFEYRQYIKGSCLVYHGRFSSSAHSRANWTAVGLPIDGNQFFGVPGGLTGSYTEDGEVINGATSKFGYRSNPPVNAQGIEDRYLPSQRNGSLYHALDTFGMRGARVETGLRIIYNLSYEGRIIDTSVRGNNIVLTRHWTVRADDIIG